MVNLFGSYPITTAFLSSFLLVGKLESYVSGKIRRHEEVILFPTLAKEANQTHWDVPIHGWIYNPEKRSKKRKALFKVVGSAVTRIQAHSTVENDAETTHEAFDKEIFSRRMEPFLVDNKRWKSPKIHILGHTFRLPISGKNGHFRGRVTVSKQELMEMNVTDGFLSMETRADDGRIFRGTAHLVPSTGLSVISDIDDTIKITNVKDKKKLLKNTFLKTFLQVPGMADLYREWQRKEKAMFHFVSSSPFQLYSELETFRKLEGFPPATFHLKTVRPKDKSISQLFADPFKSKTTTISAIINQFPNRKYILVGDSGEKDPEVYGHIARLFPRQVSRIYIRNVPQGASVQEVEEATSSHSFNNEDHDYDRMKVAFEDIPKEKWSVFDDPSEIKLPAKL